MDPIVAGLVGVLQWPAVGFLFGGIFVGMLLGIVPGLSGLTGLAILLPFTYGMEPGSAIALLLGMFAVTTTSDTITCVLIGVPGTSASTATVMDGFPLAQQGQAARALGAAFTVSGIGGLLGAVAAGISLPIAGPLISFFTSPEIFLMGVLGLTVVGSLSGRSMAMGLLAALIGLWVGTIGYSQNGAVPRFWFGVDYLLDGVPLVPLVLGLFALPELLDLTLKGTAISTVPHQSIRVGIMDGVRDAFRHWWLVLRSAVLGVYIGIIPGLGGGIADWVAYGHAVQTAKDKSRFGKGDIRGVIAPETANNAMKGGAIIPTIAFGIPGNAGMALLLGALMIHGLQPGPTLLGERLDVTFSMIWTLAIANVVAAVLLLFTAHWAAKITQLRGEIVVACVTVFVFVGAWTGSGEMGDWVVVLAFGLLGYVMKLAEIPRAPLILGFILGPIMENALFITTMSYDGLEWLLRPSALLLEGILLLIVAKGILRTLRRRRAGEPRSGRLEEAGFPAVGIAVSALSAVLFAASFGAMQDWSLAVLLMPAVIAGFGVPISLAALLGEVRDWRAGQRSGRVPAPAVASGVARAAGFFLWMCLAPALTLLVGQLVALPAFVAAYLGARRTTSWPAVGLYAFAVWTILYVLFDRTIHVAWYQGWLL